MSLHVSCFSLPDEIDVEKILEILHRKIIDLGARGMSSGVVDEAVETSVLLHRSVDQVLDLGLARDVALDEVTLTRTFRDSKNDNFRC